jgi:hypothetical protein
MNEVTFLPNRVGVEIWAPSLGVRSYKIHMLYSELLIKSVSLIVKSEAVRIEGT